MSAFGSSRCLNHNIITDFMITKAAFSGFHARSNVTNKQLSWYIEAAKLKIPVIYLMGQRKVSRGNTNKVLAYKINILDGI